MRLMPAWPSSAKSAGCWMRNLENRDPTREDLPYVQCIRRANLDAITGMSRATVNSHRLETLTTVRNAAGLNKTPSLHERGPFPLADQLGMGTAVDMLEKSRKAKGRKGAHPVRNHAERTEHGLPQLPDLAGWSGRGSLVFQGGVPRPTYELSDSVGLVRVFSVGGSGAHGPQDANQQGCPYRGHG